MPQIVFDLLHWIWMNPTVAGLALTAAAFLNLIWLHVPKELEYYWQNGQVVVNPFNIRNEIPQDIHGRIAIFHFCAKHGISLALRVRITRTIVEFALKCLIIPDPRQFMWESWFATMPVYPLGRSRLGYIRICIATKMWPWKRRSTLQRILDENGGHLPKLGEVTALAALIDRIRSHA